MKNRKKWSTLKEMLFLYLAITKLLYWFSTITEMAFGGGIADNIFELVMNRLWTQDLLILFSILIFHFMEKLKVQQLLQYAIAYVAFVGVIFAQIWIGDTFFEPAHMAGTLGGLIWEIGYLGFFIFFTVGFLFLAIALNVKEHFKKKAKESSGMQATDTELVMNDFSNALVCDSCKDELKDKLNLFGQFVGEWEFEGVSGKGTSDEMRVRGEWIFSWILSGTAIQDVFICPSREECEKNPTPDAEYGTTTRFYNQATDAWDMFYGVAGATHILEGRQVGERIVVDNKSETDGKTQWVFSDITARSFNWQNKTSHDDGVTWGVNFELSATRVV